ncbi:ribosomal-processing cysteine protease Prp [Spiroplasma turonicum]|uniref:Ribosomal processing cysteine protease Prp n=1 Tax=Spiroplasma turonicum TaxID=216946 RepID=A0A0K1P779_9MOLU|nr:ribosomal-processing cysteine protease Prp [Spiroplasma turonicum]AKU80133.1 hypothetical protein STURON_00887 [Spiroplasma turonicum]ALX71133.1 hypothetical protein STURO_v1c08820 [Spiroplasma turonicum]
MIIAEFVYVDKTINNFNVRGHANFDNYGKDIVCSAVTGIVSGALNAFDSLYNDCFKIDVKTNKISVNILKNTKEVSILLNFLLIQLETISTQYPENFIIKKVGE